MKYAEIIDKLTLGEKISLLSGEDMWHTKAISRLNIPSIMMADGPHGLRKKESEMLGGIYDSKVSVCFPTACLSSCSWDRELLKEMGKAIAEEAIAEQVSIVLGPGVNIKRSPLCGRNFEYFSEDPYLAGKLGASWIKGCEGEGIFTSLKHFACNNQEFMRMTASAEVDERSFREIYLKPFEIAIREGNPSTVMSAYNKINGTFCSSHKRLLTDILRKEWGFNGFVVSDWGAVDDRVESVIAGMDLEMPSSSGFYDQQVLSAVKDGKLKESDIDLSVERLLDKIFQAKARIKDNYKYDLDRHENLAKKIVCESAVLLKNANKMLPLSRDEKVLVIGELASKARFQGGGSSHINPTKLYSLLDGLNAIGAKFDYLAGYSLYKGKCSKELKEVLKHINEYDKIIVAVGLTEEVESEGFDRTDFYLPQVQLDLLKAIRSQNKATAVVLFGGSPVEMSWGDGVNSILAVYLGGQMTGLGAAELIYGKANPCGKLSETLPMSLESTPCYHDYDKNTQYAYYRESIFVGYRYYDTANVTVRYPFGYGLSYTDYSYSDLTIDNNKLGKGDKLKIKFAISNTGAIDGKEIAQIYIAKRGGKVFAPVHELKSFEKVFVKSGEKVWLEVMLDYSDFAYYDTVNSAWQVEGGIYAIEVGASSRDIRLSQDIEIESDDVCNELKGDYWYNHIKSGQVMDKDFSALRGYAVEEKKIDVKKGSFTHDLALADMMPNSFTARLVVRIAGFVLRMSMKTNKKNTGYLMMLEGLKTTPMRKLASASQGAFTEDMSKGVVMILNGKRIKGLKMVLKDNKNRKPLQI